MLVDLDINKSVASARLIWLLFCIIPAFCLLRATPQRPLIGYEHGQIRVLVRVSFLLVFV